PPAIQINVGDVVRWKMVSGFSNFTASLGSEWNSPILTSTNTTFSYAFTNTGFFVYRTLNSGGTIDVLPWTNVPPIVSIIFPPDGFEFFSGRSTIPLVAEVNAPMNSLATNVLEVGFVVDGTMIAWTNSPPWSATWNLWNGVPGVVGVHTLVAYVTLTSGGPYPVTPTLLSRPVRVTIDYGVISSPRKLPSGEFMCYYDSGPFGYVLFYGDDLPIGVGAIFQPLPGDYAVQINGYGVFIDFDAAKSAHRFYSSTLMLP
ncbi:MAG: hypothetical protein KGS61_17070, partial [Verrucomicrobia bacterium]|nr:hypothetical protein [Verrucomicrobiota bacterium]